MQIININPICKGTVFNVKEVELALPDNRTQIYQLVDHPDSVTILPLDENGYIWFVKQFRIGSQSCLLELPAGVLEPGEDPLECARREIREEIGMGARKFTKLGAYYLAPGYCSECNHAFLAEELFPSPLMHDDDEFLEIEKYKNTKAYELTKQGKIIDGKSLAALLLAQKHIFP